MSDSLNPGDESTVSSLSDISTNSKRSKWIGKHNRSNCLQCCRLKANNNKSSSLRGGGGGGGGSGVSGDSDISIYRRKSNQSSSIQLSDISFDSPESVFSEESMVDRLTVTILRHVQRMANPVLSKQSKMALLEVKQRYPTSFQDICLYSEVCKALSKNTYRLNSRRFLQELFLDLDFDDFYIESIDVIMRRDTKDRDATTSGLTSEQLNRLQQTSLQHTDSASPGHSSSSDQSFYTSTLKAHIKSPALPSVYETSSENLIESLGKTNQILSSDGGGGSSSIIRQNSCSNSTKSGDEKTSSSTVAESRKSGRPRFNTLELDLSCTKNKFPITNRLSKEITSPTESESNAFNTISKSSITSSTSLASPPSLTSPTLFTAPVPPGNLYCEKRLELSKSEAALSKNKERH